MKIEDYKVIRQTDGLDSTSFQVYYSKMFLPTWISIPRAYWFTYKMAVSYLHLLLKEFWYIDNEKNRKTRDRPTAYENSLNDNEVS